MGDHVDERDRHQRVGEGAAQPLRAEAAAHRSDPGDSERVEAPDQAHPEQQAGGRGELRGVERRVAGQVLPQRPGAEAVVGDAADHHDDEGDRSRDRIEPRKAAERRAHADHPAPALEHRDAREEVEVDGERLAPAAPHVDPVDGLAGQCQRGVAEHGDRQSARLFAPPRGELDPGEGQQGGRRRPAAEPLRVGPRRRPAPEYRAGCPAERPPRAQRPEDVAEQDTRKRHPDPESDEDEGRGQVAERALDRRRARRPRPPPAAPRRASRRPLPGRSSRAPGRVRPAMDASRGARAAAAARAAPKRRRR